MINREIRVEIPVIPNSRREVVSMRLSKTTLAMLAVVGSALVNPAREARAALAIAFEIVGPSGTVRNYAVDNVFSNADPLPAGYTPDGAYTRIFDTDPRVGFLGLGTVTPITGYTVEGSLQTQEIASGSPGSINELDSSSLSITNNTGGTVVATVAISGTSFRGPIEAAEASGSVTWANAIGSTITGTWYDDPQNGQGAENATDTPGSLVHSWIDTAVLLADGGSTQSGSVPVIDPALFSMSLGFVLTTTDRDGIALNATSARATNRGQTEIKAVVPEPSTVAMAGLMSLAGLGYAWRRKRATA